MEDEIFKGYAIAEIGNEKERMPPVTLRGVKEALNYCLLQSRFFPEVFIVDDNDLTIMHVIDGELIHPIEFKEKFTIMRGE